jgi:hypothetical protein
MRNKMAKALADRLYRQRKVESKKTYSRSKDKSQASRLVRSERTPARSTDTE